MPDTKKPLIWSPVLLLSLAAPLTATPVVVYTDPAAGGAIYSIRINGAIRYQVRAVGKVELLQEGGSIVPPPPTVPTLTGLSLPAAATVGATFPATVTLSGPAATATVVSLSTSNPAVVAVPGTVTVPGGSTQAQAPASALAAGTATVTARLGTITQQAAVTVSASPPPPPPPPPPGPVKDVTQHGAIPNDGRDDRTALNNLMARLVPGDVVYFPAGRYELGGSIRFRAVDRVTFRGQGAASVLAHGGNTGIQCGTGGENATGIVIEDLGFEGRPGVYFKDGNSGHAIELYGPDNTTIQRCTFRGVGFGVFSAGPSGTNQGTRVLDCVVNGWGTVGLYLSGGEYVRNVQLVQDDPDVYGQRSGHGVYIRSGAHNTTLEDVLITNVRLYALQVYGEQVGTTSDNITLRRITVRNCQSGITIQAGSLNAARPRNLLIEDIDIDGVYGSSGGIGVKTVDGGTVRRVKVANVAGAAGIYVGNWAPYEQGWNLKDLTITDVTASGCPKGAVWVNGSNGGTFTNLRVGPGITTTQGVPVLREGNTSGLIIVPGRVAPGRPDTPPGLIPLQGLVP